MPKAEERAVTIVSAQLDLADRRRLEQLAREGDRSVSAEIRRAIREHIEQAAEERSE